MDALPPYPPLALSTCELSTLDGAVIHPAGLCINRRPGHVGLREHQSNLVSYLRELGVPAGRNILRDFGPVVLDSVLAEIAADAAAGLDSLAGARSLVGVVRWRCAKRAEDLGIVTAVAKPAPVQSSEHLVRSEHGNH